MTFGMAFLVVFLVAVSIAWLLNSMLLFLLAKKFAPDPREVTFLGAMWCSFLLAALMIGAGIAGGLCGMIPGIFLPAVGNVIGFLVAISLFFKWGAGAIRSTFEMGSSANTVLVLYLVIPFVISFGLDLLKDDSSSSEEISAYYSADEQLDEDDYSEQETANLPVETSATPESSPPAQRAEQLQSQAGQLWQEGRHQEALQAAQEALTIYQTYLPPEDEKIQGVKRMIEAARQQMPNLAAPTPNPTPALLDQTDRLLIN